MLSLTKVSLKFSVILFTIIICLGGCTNDRPIQGFDLTDSEDLGHINARVISTILLEKSIRDTTAATGKSPFLLLGSYNNLETKILIKFENIPDTVVVTTAAIELRTRSIIGPKDFKTSFNADVHRVTSEWDEESVKFETFENAFDVNPIGTTEILSVDREFTDNDTVQFETVRFELNEEGVDLVNGWLDTTDMVENNGVFINFTNSSFIKEFFSINSANLTPPKLVLEILNNGSEIDTIFAGATADAYLVQSFEDLLSHPLYVDHVFSRQSIIKFDFSEIPRESFVNRVSMELNIEEKSSFLNDDGFIFQIQRLTEPYTSPDSIKLDPNLVISQFISPTQSSVVIPDANPSNIGIFTRIIQDWIAQDEEGPNHGFVIKTTSPGLDVSRVAFFSSKSDSIEGTDKAPKINIDFSVPPSILYNK